MKAGSLFLVAAVASLAPAAPSVNCGPGLDKAKVDGVGKLTGCERLIKVKTAKPVRR